MNIARRRAVPRGNVEPAFVDQGYTGKQPEADAADAGMERSVVKLRRTRRGFVPLSRPWVVERSFARATRLRRQAEDFERPPITPAGLHSVAYVCLILRNLMEAMRRSA